MAGTFRDFMLGLADAAPKLAELMSNYSMFAQQQQNVERQLGMEEQRTKASVKASESQAKYMDMQTEELKLLMPIKQKYEELKLQNEEFILNTNKALQEAKEDYKKLNKGRSFDLDKMINETNLLKAQIAEVYNKMSNENARTQLAEWAFDLQKTEFGLNVYNTFGELAVDDKSMGLLNSHWEKSKGNIQNFIDYIRTDKDLALMNPRVSRMMPMILQTVNEYDKMRYDSNLRKAEAHELLYNSGKRNEAMKGLGVKTPQEFQNELLKLRTRPEFDWAGLTGSVLNESERLKTMGDGSAPQDPGGIYSTEDGGGILGMIDTLAGKPLLTDYSSTVNKLTFPQIGKLETGYRKTMGNAFPQLTEIENMFDKKLRSIDERIQTIYDRMDE